MVNAGKHLILCQQLIAIAWLEQSMLELVVKEKVSHFFRPSACYLV